MRDKPTAPASPWQNGFAERLIGSIRREHLPLHGRMGRGKFAEQPGQALYAQAKRATERYAMGTLEPIECSRAGSAK
jgi:hypothetical protein